MPTDIVIPALGESITSGVIATWRKKDGDRVERDEPVLDLETDKITLELPSPAAGVLKRTAAEGDTVDVGAVVGVIEDKPGAAGPVAAASAATPPAPKAPPANEPRAQASGSPTPQAPRAPTPTPPPAAAPTAPRARPSAPPPAAPRATPPSEPGAAATGATTPADIRATPLARKEAETRGVDLSRVKGTGPGGRVSEHDVLAATVAPPTPGSPELRERGPSSDAGAPAPTPSPQGPRSTTRERVSPLRQKIAQRLVEAQHTAAMLTTFNECDMTAVMDLRARYKESFEKKHAVGLGFMSFFVKAAVSALQQYPLVNGQLAEDPQGRLEVLKHHYCDIAVAVGTPKGLTVPVLRNCETLSMAAIESGIKDLAARAKDGRLTLEELQGGTFTITNGGIYGSMMSTPILNPPQSAILGMHNIVRRPVENPDKPRSGEVVVRPMMYLALSYDHRIIDGAEAVSFLVHIKRAIEAPERLLLDL